MDIISTDVTGLIDIEKPKPASKMIPEWLKKTKSYMVGNRPFVSEDGHTNSTIKKCIPIFDSLTSGYIITTPSDILVSVKDGEQFYTWAKHMSIDFHSTQQVGDYPLKTDFSAYPKFVNPWSIKTPKGYSCLFIQPPHRDLPFTIFTGIVDTDQYLAPVNFPFIMKDPTFEGLIPKGTPMVQVIPFKRDTWSMKYGEEKELREIEKHNNTLMSKLYDRYKSMFWEKKEYR
jgi:hypothetical protein